MTRKQMIQEIITLAGDKLTEVGDMQMLAEETDGQIWKRLQDIRISVELQENEELTYDTRRFDNPAMTVYDVGYLLAEKVSIEVDNDYTVGQATSREANFFHENVHDGIADEIIKRILFLAYRYKKSRYSVLTYIKETIESNY